MDATTKQQTQSTLGQPGVNVSNCTVKLSSGYSIPQVALGVYKAPNDDTTETAVKQAFDAGYRHIDSAARYKNEEAVGRALKDWCQANNGKREDFFITTKLWDDDHSSAADAIEDSLKKLQVDYIDLYLIHSPGAGTESFLEAWRELEAAVEAGKLRSIGVSNFDVEDLDELLKVARIKPVVNQIEVHPLFQHAELCAASRERGLLIEAYSPIAQGAALENDSVREIAEKHSKTPAQVLLRWGLQKGNIILPKSLTKHRIESNAQLFDFSLDEKDMDVLNGLDCGLKTGKLGPPGTSQPSTPATSRPSSRMGGYNAAFGMSSAS